MFCLTFCALMGSMKCYIYILSLLCKILSFFLFFWGILHYHPSKEIADQVVGAHRYLGSVVAMAGGFVRQQEGLTSDK